jgi:hypothetical protein
LRLHHPAIAILVGSALLFFLPGLPTWVPRIDSRGKTRPGKADGRTDESLALQLEEKRRALFQFVEAKAAVARELAAGRLTLFEAASRARHVDHQNPDFHWEEFRRGTPGGNDDERHCWEVIELLRGHLSEGPHAEELVTRHTAELQRHLDRGPLCLPNQGAVDEGP